MQGGNPDRERVFQTAAWIWLAYEASLAVIDRFIYTSQPLGPILRYHLFNVLPALIFLGAAYAKILKNRAKIVAPLMIALITLIPILVNHIFNLHLPPAPLSNLEGMVLRQLPVLFIGLVLVAWRYNLATIILYSLGINLFELGVVSGFGLLGDIRPTDFYFIIVIRAVCFIVVGIFVNQLVSRLRAQQESLLSANLHLSHYASTLESLTVSRERNRMSRELHDTAVHTLSGLSVQLETTKAYWEVNPETARNLLDKALLAVRSGLQETRRAIKSLRASPLEDLGLVKAIQLVAETAAQRGRLLTDISLPAKDPSMSPDEEQCIYRVAQEAIENVVRHASAQHLCVRLSVNNGDIELVVQDDGTGFNTTGEHHAGHFGLAGMKERAELVGGTLTIASQPNAGTTVSLVIKGYSP